MMYRVITRGRLTVALLAAAALSAGCETSDITNAVGPTARFAETRLVADAASLGAAAVDPLLVNPWGLAFGASGTAWVANNGSSTSTLYDASGAKQATVVAIPSASGVGDGAPTGVVANTTADFTIPSAGVATFIFASEDGTISAWNANTASALVVADRSDEGAVYKGVAIGSDGTDDFVYATDFHNARIDVFDTDFQYVGSFTDAAVSPGFAPFGIQNLGGDLVVTFAKQLAPDNEEDEPGPGNGFVAVFNGDGSVASHFAAGGSLDSPWGLAIAPSGFGDLAGALLVGNFGDGRISAFDPSTGAFVGYLLDANDSPIAIDGLWALSFGSGTNAATLYYTAGPSDETHGLFGKLTVR